MKYDLDILNKYVNDGLINVQNHPIYPLRIYNYSRTCQYDNKWDDITRACRGLILDYEGNVIGLPFPKFFNMEELSEQHIPINENFEVSEKMDGSLGIIFHYDNQWHVATRGSFTSDQAIKGKQLLDRLNTKYGLLPGYTYLAEIIYPENRIVVDYGKAERLVFLTCFNNEFGTEGNILEMENEGFTIVTTYNGINDFRDLKSKIHESNEGFVIKFESGFRMKIKGEEYIRLHRILTNFSTKEIWLHLKDNIDLTSILERIPDEFDNWVKSVVNTLRIEYTTIELDCKQATKEILDCNYKTQRDIAFHVFKFDKKYQSIIFNMLRNMEYDHIIWKLIKPKYSKPFVNDNI